MVKSAGVRRGEGGVGGEGGGEYSTGFSPFCWNADIRAECVNVLI